MAVKSSRDELHKLFQQRTGFTEAPIDYTKYSNKQVSTSRQLSARQQQDEYRIAMRRLGYEFSTDSTYAPEEGESRLSPSYAFTTGQQREAQASIKELMEKYRQQEEYRKESRELQPLDRTALMPKDTSRLSPEILRSEVASGVRDWQAYDLAKKEEIKAPKAPEAPNEKTNFFKAVGNSLLAGIINMARQTVSNAPSLAGGATPEQEEKTRQAVQKIIDATAPKEDQSVKPIWQGSFHRQAENMAKTPDLTKTLASISESVQKTPERTEKYLSVQEQEARQRANLENASRVTRLFAGAAESLPLSLATRIPYLGWLLMANTSFKNSLEQSVLDMPNPTEEQANMMMIKAIGDAALEVGTEMIFPLYGSASATVKGMAKGTIKPTLANATKGLIGMFKKGAIEVITPTIKNVSKQILKQATEEAIEEGINYFLGAYLAVLTTEQGKNVWDKKDGKESIASSAGLIDAMATGAISGGGMTATRFAAPTAGYYYQNFKNTRKAVEEIGDKTLDEITTEDAKKINDAIINDMNVPENAEAVIKTVVDAVEKGTPIATEVPTTEDFNVVVDEQNNMRREEQPATMPVEAPTRPSERVQEPVVSVPSEEPAIAPEAPSEVPRPQQAPAEEPKQEAKTVEQKAVDTFGITNVPYEAGYILQDGRTLDFSEKNDGGEPGTRTRDHRDVQQFYEGFDTATEAMSQFIEDTGAVRVGIAQNNAFADIIISKPITDKQKRKLANMFSKRESVSIDIYQNAKDNAPIKSITLEMPLMSTITKAIDDAYKIEQPSEATSEQAPAEEQFASTEEQKERISELRENIKALRQQMNVVEESSKPAYLKRIEQYESEIKAIQSKLPKAPRKVNTIDSLTKEIEQLKARKEKEPLAINKRAYSREIEKRGKLLAKLKGETQAPAEDGKISLDNAEVISDKSSTGKVYRIGDKVYKSALFVGLLGMRIPNGRPTIEAQVYEELKNSDAIGRGHSVEIDGKPYIELPYYERVISTDEIQTADREMYQPIIEENIDRIIQSVQDLSNAGYDYGDPLQFGYDGDKMYLIDFSNTLKGEPNEVLNDNYNRLSNFFKEFGFERMEYIVSRGMKLRRNLESLVYEDVDKEDYNMSLKFTPEEIRGTVDELKQSSGDMQPNNVYYATNGRGIQIGNIMQTDRINGVKHIFSETPLDPKVVADWEMKPIYVGSVPSTNPEVKEQKKARLQSKAKANAHPVDKPVKKEAPKAKKKRQYYSLLTNAEGKPTPSPVDGKAIKLDGMPNTEFFIRKTDKGKKGSWSVIEASSGLAISVGQLTRKVAIEIANNNINRYGKDAILEKVKSSVDKFGSMPVEFVEEVRDVQQQPEKPKEPPKITYVHGKTAADFHVAPEPKVETKAEPTQKAQAEEVAKEPTLTVSMQDLMNKYASGTTREELAQDIDRWLDSDDPEASEIKSIKSESELGAKLLDLKVKAEQNELDDKEYMKIDLQLLGLDAWSRRLANIPKGSAITEHMRKLVELFRSGSSQKVKNEINKIVDNSMLFHEIIADKAVIDEATANMQYGDEEYKAQFRKGLIAKFTSHAELTRADLVMGDMYAVELQQSGNVEDAIAVSDIVAQRIGEIAGLLRAGLLSKQLHGFGNAKRLINDFDAQVDPLAKDKVENAGKETANIINKAKDDSIRDAAKDFVSTGADETIRDADKTREDVERKTDEKKAIRDGARKMQDAIDKPPADPTDFDDSTEEEADLAQVLADMIERYETAEPKASEGMTDAERLLHNLMVKYKERNPKYNVKLKPSPFAVLTDIIKNKDQYAEVWEGAQAIFRESQQGKDESLDWIKRFIDTFISPTHAVSADKFMRSVVRAQLKRMDISIADLALEFSKSPDVTISKFFTELRKSLSVLTDAEFAYVQKYMQDYMTQMMTEMNEKRKAKLREVKDVRKQKPRKLKNEVDEQLANMIANNIRLHNKTEAPKVRTAEEKLISALYKKHTDYFGKKKKTPANIFDMLADIVTDRQAYEHIWFSARSLLQSYPDLAFSDVYTVMQNFNNPIVAESIMRGVVAQIVKENGKTFTETARDYYFNQNTTFKNFFTVLRGKIPDLGDADVKYLYDLFRPYFDKAMDNKRNQVRESLQRQVQRRKKIVETKGALQQTIDRMMDIAFRDELSIPELNALWAQRMGLPYLTEDMRKDIYETMIKVHSLTNSDDVYDEVFNLQQRLAENTPADWVDKVLAWSRAAMLLNPTTLLGNGTSNMAMVPMYNMSDRVQYLFEKIARVPAEDRISGKKIVKVDNTTEIGRTVLEYSTPEKIKRHLSKSEKWGIQRIIGVERQYSKSRRIDALLKSVGKAMNFGEIGKLKISYLGDNKPYTMHFRRSMANTLSAMNYNESLPEEQKTDMITKAIDKATKIATVRTFRQKLVVADMIIGMSKPAYTNKQIREASPEEAKRMRYANQRKRLFARFAFPFVVTPVALVAETYKFSPYAGIIAFFEIATRKAISMKNGTPIPTETKTRIARQLAQSAVGTTVAYSLGVFLSSLGYVDTDEPESPREENAWLLEGRQRYSIRIPGYGSVSLGFLQPLATAFFIGANHQKVYSADGLDIYAMLKSSVDTLAQATILRDIFNPFNAGSFWKSSDQVEDFFTNAIFMLFPNIVRKFNQAVDPYQRDVYGGTAWEDIKSKFLSYVPFGSYLVPPKIDMFGHEVKPLKTGGVLGVAERTFLTFTTPFTVRRKGADVVADEIIRVYNESKDLDAVPSFPGKTFAGQTLDREEYTWYIKESGQTMYDAVKEVLAGGSAFGIKDSEKYNSLTAQEQAKILNKIYDKARAMAREKWKTMGSKLPEE